MNISEVASNYSVALIDSCSDKNEVEKLFDELNIFLELYKNNNEFKNFLSNFFYSVDYRYKTLCEICLYLKLSNLTSKFIQICFRNSRIEDIEFIILNLKSHLDILNNTKIAEIYSVHHLNDKEMTDIKNILIKKFSSNFVIKNIIDQSLISGIKILFENKIIDISLSGILKYYQNCLIKEN